MAEVRKKSTRRDCSKYERGARCPNVQPGFKIFRRFLGICAYSPGIVPAKCANNEGECDNEENPEDVGCIVYHRFLQVANVVLVLVSKPDMYFMAFQYLIFVILCLSMHFDTSKLFVKKGINLSQYCLATKLLREFGIWEGVLGIWDGVFDIGMLSFVFECMGL